MDRAALAAHHEQHRERLVQLVACARLSAKREADIEADIGAAPLPLTLGSCITMIHARPDYFRMLMRTATQTRQPLWPGLRGAHPCHCLLRVWRQSHRRVEAPSRRGDSSAAAQGGLPRAPTGCVFSSSRNTVGRCTSWQRRPSRRKDGDAFGSAQGSPRHVRCVRWRTPRGWMGASRFMRRGWAAAAARRAPRCCQSVSRRPRPPRDAHDRRRHGC